MIDPEDYEVGGLVLNEYAVFRRACAAFDASMGCDAYQAEVDQARLHADRLGFALDDLKRALSTAKGASEPDGAAGNETGRTT